MTEHTRVKRRIAELADMRPTSDTPDVPRTILLEVSNLCNHACVFCAYPKMTRPGKRMDLALTERGLREAYALGTREAGFYSGAEPFTTPDLETIVELAKAIGYEYTFISTNGSLATEARLTRLIDGGLDSIKFSINAGDRETYKRIHGQDHFERVLRHVKFASDYRARVGAPLYLAVSFVGIDNDAASNVGTRAALEALVGPWVDEIFFCDATSENGQMIGLEPDEITAPWQLPFFRLHVSAEGYLRMCCNDYQNYLRLVDLNHSSLRDAWYSPIFREMRRRHLENRLEGTLCHNCIHNANTPIEPIVPALAVKVAPELFVFRK
jgi:organic radical activating enzyme